MPGSGADPYLPHLRCVQVDKADMVAASVRKGTETKTGESRWRRPVRFRESQTVGRECGNCGNLNTNAARMCGNLNTNAVLMCGNLNTTRLSYAPSSLSPLISLS